MLPNPLRFLVFPLLLSGPAFGQVGTRFPGGTPGSDDIQVPPPDPGLVWHVYDGGPTAGGGGLAGDGHRDDIDAVNGVDDVINAGIEDSIQADPDDFIAIHVGNGGPPIWTGTWEEYLLWRLIVHRVLDRLEKLLHEGLSLFAALQTVSDEHQAVCAALPEDPAQVVAMATYFDYATFQADGDVSDLPSSWTNGYTDVPVAEVEDLYYETLPAGQLAAAMDGVVLLTDHWQSDL